MLSHSCTKTSKNCFNNVGDGNLHLTLPPKINIIVLLSCLAIVLAEKIFDNIQGLLKPNQSFWLCMDPLSFWILTIFCSNMFVTVRTSSLNMFKYSFVVIQSLIVMIGPAECYDMAVHIIKESPPWLLSEACSVDRRLLFGFSKHKPKSSLWINEDYSDHPTFFQSSLAQVLWSRHHFFRSFAFYSVIKSFQILQWMLNL